MDFYTVVKKFLNRLPDSDRYLIDESDFYYYGETKWFSDKGEMYDTYYHENFDSVVMSFEIFGYAYDVDSQHFVHITTFKESFDLLAEAFCEGNEKNG